MLRSLRLRLSKKDVLLKNWWNYLSENEINISQTINYTIRYYIRTGDYLTIGDIKVDERDFTPVDRKIYLNENSETYKWLLTKVEEGEKISTTIKKIIKRCLSESSTATKVMDLDDIIRASEDLDRKYLKEPLYNNKDEVLPEKPVTNEDRLSKEKPYETTEKESEPKMEPLTTSWKSEEEEEKDLFDSLITHRLIL